MKIYTVIIFLPVPDWYSKLLGEFVTQGWKVSVAAENKQIVNRGTLSSAINFDIESNLSNDALISKIKKILNESEISFFGVIAISGHAAWDSSNTKIEKSTPYRD